MKLTMSPEAVNVGDLVRERMAAAGGVDVLRGCVADPSQRAGVERMLDGLGIWDIDASSDAVELEAAAEVCRAAGHFALPYPVAERLGASGADATALVARRGPRVASHLDLDLSWNGIDLEGRRYRLAASPGANLLGSHPAPFGVEAVAIEEGEPARREAAVLVILQSWWLLGLLQNAVEDTVRYTREREQFGRKLAQFQAVAFQLSDMVLETEASGELAKYALWSVSQGSDAEDALVEGLGLRLALQRAADVVMRGAHQLHGAMGFTDEVDVSWLSRASQGPRRLPEDSHRTAGVLLSAVEQAGYSELGHMRSRVADTHNL